MKAEACLELLLDPYTMLGMCALLPLPEAIDTLVAFAQKRDIYICDFVAAVKVCQAAVYQMYEDQSTAYKCDDFWSFNNLLECSHEQIHLKWKVDLNGEIAILTFVCYGEQIHSEHKGRPVDCELWGSLVREAKSECSGDLQQTCLSRSLMHGRFPAQHVMNAFGILYTQYWCEIDAEEMFDKHLRVLMDTYGHGKILGEGDQKILIKPLINREAIMSQRSFFKTCMKSNSRAAMLAPLDLNPLTKVWRMLDGNNSLTQNSREFLKLAEMALVHVVGSVEDERLFSSMGFSKSELHSRLDENMEVAVGMFSQRVFTLDNFPYQKLFDQWFVAGARGRYLASS